MQDFDALLTAPDSEMTSTCDAIVERLASDVSTLNSYGIERIGVATLHNPFSASDIHGPDVQRAYIIDLVNDRIALMASSQIQMVDIGRCLAGRGTEFTKVFEGSFALNTLGHGVSAGLVQEWVSGDAKQARPPTSPELRYRHAHGLA
ncbi:MAG: hypothetical protein ABIQ34_15470 [Tepidiformaceae bacterium]